MEKTNKYLMSITHFFGAKEQFEIEALNKADAIEKAKKHILWNTHYYGGNFDLNSIKCIKKIQK